MTGSGRLLVCGFISVALILFYGWAIFGYPRLRIPRFASRAQKAMPAPERQNCSMCPRIAFQVMAIVPEGDGDVQHAVLFCREHGTLKLLIGELYDDFVEEFQPRWKHGGEEE